MIGTLGAPFPDVVTFGILAIYAVAAVTFGFALVRRFRNGSR